MWLEVKTIKPDIVYECRSCVTGTSLFLPVVVILYTNRHNVTSLVRLYLIKVKKIMSHPHITKTDGKVQQYHLLHRI